MTENFPNLTETNKHVCILHIQEVQEPQVGKLTENLIPETMEARRWWYELVQVLKE